MLLKTCKISKEKPVLESLFNWVASLRPEFLLKRDSNTGVFLWNLQNLIKNTFFTEHLLAGSCSRYRNGLWNSSHIFKNIHRYLFILVAGAILEEVEVCKEYHWEKVVILSQQQFMRWVSWVTEGFRDNFLCMFLFMSKWCTRSVVKNCHYQKRI